jgi:hypothetical protein
MLTPAVNDVERETELTRRRINWPSFGAGDIPAEFIAATEAHLAPEVKPEEVKPEEVKPEEVKPEDV